MSGKRIVLGMVALVIVSMVVGIYGPWAKAIVTADDNGETRIEGVNAFDGVPDFGSKVGWAGALADGVTPAGSAGELGYKPGEIIVKFKEPVASTLKDQLSKGLVVSELRLSGSLDRLSAENKVKGIKPLIKNFDADRERIENLLKKDKSLLSARERHLVNRLKRAPKGAKVPDLGRIYKIELEQGQSEEDAVADYSADPDVEYAELNYTITLCSTEPNDPNYDPEQWALNNTGQNYPVLGGGSESGTDGCDINAPEVWDITTGSSDVIVAVLDTGVDYTHRDLRYNMWTDASGRPGYDFADDDNDPWDYVGHGTHCAGTIAADGNNGFDVAGVSWRSRIMAVKIFPNYGSEAFISGAFAAIHYAVDNGADILSNSWGGGPPSETLEQAINYAYDNGAVFVAAAGNNNSSAPFYPASYDHVIAVAATDSDDDKASFSNYGDWVDIAAPGVKILSLRGSGTDIYQGSSGYTPGDAFYPYGDDDATMYICSGTSMACPHVAGACALLLSVDPCLTPDDINEILTDTNSTDPIDPNICWSDGRLNVHKALVAAIPEAGHISLDREYYNCSDKVDIFLADWHLADENDVNVNIVCDGDEETVTLTETGTDVGVFGGSISTSAGDPISQNGTLQVSDGNTITVTYIDDNDGDGNEAEVNDTAVVDCVYPVISNVDFEVIGPDVTVTLETDEKTMALMLYGTSCNDTNCSSVDWGTDHSIKLYGVSAWTDYYFKITATDLAGNEVVDDNDGNCYQFSTRGPEDINVPGDYNTIQEAIDQSWDGGRVIVDEGTYYEQIDFLGKAITVMSTDPNDWYVVEETFIDANDLNAVTFKTGENENSVLTGFRVKGNPGVYSTTGFFLRPTVSKCVIEGDIAVKVQFASAVVEGCRVKGSEYGLYLCDTNGVTVRNCDISGSFYGIYCELWNTATLIENNWIYDNTMGIMTFNPNPVVATVRNNTFTKNNLGINESRSSLSMLTVSNCIFWDNSVYDLYNSSATYSCIQRCNEADGTGNICGDANDPCFVDADANDFHIDIHSPCVDAGNPSGDYSDQTDIDGEARVINGRVDMGADEVVLPDAHWWKFDEGSGTMAGDSIGYADGTLVGDANWTTGVFDDAVTLDGSGDYVSVSSLDGEYDGSDTFSVAGWFTTEQTTGKQTVVGQWLQVNPYRSVMLYFGWQVLVEDGDVKARFANGGSSVTDIAGPTGINNRWHHFALVYATSTDVTLYVDGTAYEGTETYSSSGAVFRIGDGSFVAMGSPVMKGGPFNGDIDDVVIYERALSTDEVKSLYQAGAYKAIALSSKSWWKFDEGSGATAEDCVGDSNGTLHNDPCWVDGIFGYALEFFGDTSSPNYVSVSSLNGEYSSSDTFSVAGWFTTEQSTGKQTVVGQWAQYNPQGSPPEMWWGWQVLVEDGDVKARFANGGASVTDIAGPTGINDRWHHFALVYATSTDVTLYLDGTAYEGTGTYSSSLGVFRIGDGSFVPPDGESCTKKGGPFNGDIDDVMIYERALSAEEVELLWESGL